MTSYKLSMLSLLPEVHAFVASVLEEKEITIDRLQRDARVRIRRRMLLQKINDPNYTYTSKYNQRAFESKPIAAVIVNNPHPSSSNSDESSSSDAVSLQSRSFTLDVELVQVNFTTDTHTEPDKDIAFSFTSTPVSDISELFIGIRPENLKPEEVRSSRQLRIETSNSAHIDYHPRKIVKPQRVLRDICYQSDIESDDDDEEGGEEPSAQMIKTQQTINTSDEVTSSSPESVSILTDDSNNHYEYYSESIPPPDLQVDYLWQLTFNHRDDVYDSEYFEFGLWKWRLTLYKLPDRSQYALMLSPFHRSTKAKMMCIFTLVGFLRPDHIKRSNENLDFDENTSRYRGCERFIGEDIVQYLDDDQRLTIRAYLCSDLRDGHLVGYNTEAFAQDIETFTITDLTIL
jgi:hypothetical protein